MVMKRYHAGPGICWVESLKVISDLERTKHGLETAAWIESCWDIIACSQEVNNGRGVLSDATCV